MFFPWEMEFQMHPTPYRSLYRFLGLSITISITVPCFLCSSPVDPRYANCTQPFKCGDPSALGELNYPFWGINRASYCGKSGFEIKCVNNNPVINISTLDLQIIGTNPQAHEITVVVKVFLHNICPPAVFNKINDSIAYASLLSINSGSVFTNSSIRLLTILYGCPSDLGHQLGWSGADSCSINNTSIDVHFVTHTVNISNTWRCKSVVLLPIPEENAQALDKGTITLPKALDEGFGMNWLLLEDDKYKTCVRSGGQFGYNSTIAQFTCYCPDKPYPVQCPKSQRGCASVVLLPIPEEKAQALDESTITLPKALDEGYEMNWLPLEDDEYCKACVGSGGQCGYNWTETRFTCYCPDKPYALQCPRSKRGNPKKMVSIAASLATATGIVIMGFFVFFSKKIFQKCKPIPQDRSVEDCLKNYTSSFPRRYTYASVKKMTNSFEQKLGEGGYGAVFKGSLLDGRIVAVKIWNPSKGDGQEFVNEVMSISRTSHVNIVPLLGFCFEGHRRALIYEFMPNGSLEKFIRRRDSIENNQSLSSPKLLEIVVGIAKGLEYLHRGCNTRIVHFDIKPHNILLDAEFTPKISDFGLAKAFKQKESIISMSGARGTVGYIAPEVILRSFGGVSHKSDVYSFGMMILEMVGCTKRLNYNVENSSESYFPQWIYKQLEQEITLDSDDILNEEKELEQKMILVGLWCIQTNPMSRPPMSRVVEMLEGTTELLQVPSMPSLASPPTQQPTDDGSSSFQLSTTSICP